MKKIEKIAIQKEESRAIVKKIIDFGITEDQKIDIMYFLAMNLHDNATMKEICLFLNKFTNKVNKEDENNKIKETSKKIIIN